MGEEFDWRLFFGCLHPLEKILLVFIDTIRAAGFYVLADLVDATASIVGISGLRYEVFKQTYIVASYILDAEEPIRFYELDARMLRGLRTYLNSGSPEKCRTIGVWNTVS